MNEIINIFWNENNTVTVEWICSGEDGESFRCDTIEKESYNEFLDKIGY